MGARFFGRTLEKSMREDRKVNARVWQLPNSKNIPIVGKPILHCGGNPAVAGATPLCSPKTKGAGRVRLGA
jgi:hypothetical protein